MPTYTTATAVEYGLPSLPASITTAHKTQWITDASALVDAHVGSRFPVLSSSQKFADITDSPATPPVIEVIARWLAMYFGFVRLKEVNRAGEGTDQAKAYWDKAMAELEKIAGGMVDVLGSDGSSLAVGSLAASTTTDIDPEFSRGRRSDGVLQGDPGTLDDFGL